MPSKLKLRVQTQYQKERREGARKKQGRKKIGGNQGSESNLKSEV
jgi:hypothetical protein